MANSGNVPQTELVPLQSKHEHLLNELEQTETNNVGLVIRYVRLFDFTVHFSIASFTLQVHANQVG